MAATSAKKGLRGRSFWALIVTQFLGAFNDNAFKMIVIFVAIRGLIAAHGGGRYLSAATSAFGVAYIVFSSWAGYLSDRFSKRTVAVYAKLAEVLVMVLAYFALVSNVETGDRVSPILVLLLMAVQSTFFSPSKYGILPELLADEELSQANGILNMTTYLAIIAGTATSGWLKGMFPGPAMPSVALVFVALAVLGTLASLFIEKVPPSGSQRKFRWNFLADSLSGVRRTSRDKPLFLCMLANMYVWVFGAVVLQNFAPYAQELMGLDPEVIGSRGEQTISALLGVMGIGVGLGSVLAGRLSGRKVEFGLVPLGAIGMTVFTLALVFTFRSVWLTGAALAMIGASAGFFVVPLNAYIQQRSPKQGRGEAIGVLNFITFSGIIIAAAFVFLLSEGLKLDPATIFLVFGIITAGVAAYLCSALPDFPIRSVVWLATHTIHRLRVVGAENVPKDGPALLVCNHVSLADAALITACIQRPIRFVMHRRYYEHRLLHRGAVALRAIPVAPEDGPKALVGAFSEARRALTEDGDLVCIFAEGCASRSAKVLGFHSGFEQIIKGSDVPVIPVHLDRVRGSVFNFERGWFLRFLPSPVTVSFGRPMPAPATAHDVRTAVAELGAEAFALRKEARLLLHHELIRVAKARWRAPCVADSSGVQMTYGRLLVAGVLLARRIRRASRGAEYAGLLLPPSAGGAVANVAALLAGKVPVNLNYTASREAIDSAVAACRITTILTSRKFIEKAKLEPIPGMVMLEDVMAGISRSEKVVTAAAIRLLPRRALQLLYGRRGLRAGNPATVIFSSGSTGVPKGVVLSHRNIISNIVACCQILDLRPGHCLCGVIPFFHSFGFTVTLWTPLLRGFRIAYHANPLDGKTIGRLIREHKATHFIGTPTFLMAYTRQCEPDDLRTLKIVIAGAEKLKPRIADAFEATFGIRPLEGYGCTELSPVVAVNVPDIRTAAGDVQIGTKEGTVGRPLPNVAAKVVDIETGKPLQPGQEGLLLIKGPNVMLGYLGQPEKTAEAVQDGWYRTGDIARIDDDGFITITARLSRFSKLGGEMVPHLAVEEAIYNILGVGGAEHVCIVTSVPDERKGEQLAVLHTRLPISVDELWRKLNETDLPKLWIPRREMFHEVDEIPLLASGKIALARVRRIAAEVWGAQKRQSG